MNIGFILSRFLHFIISRYAVVLLFALAWNSLAYCGEIHDAAQAEDLAKGTALLMDNPDLVSSKGNDGNMPLHKAAEEGRKDVVEITRTKADILRISDQLFGKRYEPVPGKRFKHYNIEEESGPPDAVFYRHGSSYVIQLTFSTKNEFVRIELFPEALLYSDDWSDVPKDVELASSERQWMIDMANKLQPVGNAVLEGAPPDGLCFQSGANWYCGDMYQFASVSHYWREELEKKIILRKVAIGYLKAIAGKISKVKVIDKETLDLEIGSFCYRVSIKDGDRRQSTVKKGSFVRLVTCGCTGKEKSCNAHFEASEKQ
jgi:hypothetical protein